jgi:hypothetical protein
MYYSHHKYTLEWKNARNYFVDWCMYKQLDGIMQIVKKHETMAY